MRQHGTESPLAGGSPASRLDKHLLASLALGFARDENTTRLIRREHLGPLMVQKPLYPEGADCCHAVIVHPPGGVLGGDELNIHASVADDGCALLSTPGAAKWYRANGHIARQLLAIDIGPGAAMEWLPQETILFNQSDVVLDSRIQLHGDARYLGCEILCFGRTASGERFEQGRLRQKLSIQADDKLLWLEQGCLVGGSSSMQSPLGLAGHTVCASLLGAGAPLTASAINAVRDACAAVADGTGKFGATQMKSGTKAIIVVRYLGDSSEIARRVMLAAWQVLRPEMLGRKANELRIWNT